MSLPSPSIPIVFILFILLAIGQTFSQSTLNQSGPQSFINLNKSLTLYHTPDCQFFTFSLGDINNDSFPDFALSCEETGSVWIYSSEPNNSDSLFPWYSLQMPHILSFGFTINRLGDINGDFIDDFSISAPYYNNSGHLYIYYGNNNNIFQENTTIMSFNSSFNSIGFHTSPAGDINGDGLNDILFSGFFQDSLCGFLFFGNLEMNQRYDLDKFDGIHGIVFYDILPNKESFLFSSLNFDINGDGHNDIVLSQPKQFDLVFGNEHFTTDQKSTSTINFLHDFGPNTIASLGDINDDGFDDLLIAPLLQSDYINKSTVALVILGRSNWNQFKNGFFIRNESGIEIHLSNPIKPLKFGGDLNHDGISDIIFSSLSDKLSDKESSKILSSKFSLIYVFFGSSDLPESFDSDSIDGSNGAIIEASSYPSDQITILPNYYNDQLLIADGFKSGTGSRYLLQIDSQEDLCTPTCGLAEKSPSSEFSILPLCNIGEYLANEQGVPTCTQCPATQLSDIGNFNLDGLNRFHCEFQLYFETLCPRNHYLASHYISPIAIERYCSPCNLPWWHFPNPTQNLNDHCSFGNGIQIYAYFALFCILIFSWFKLSLSQFCLSPF